MRAIYCLVTLWFVLLSTTAVAEVPGSISYQGTLADEHGVAWDSTISMTFSTSADSTGDNQVWTETQPSVKVTNGPFNVFLGSANAIPDSVFEGSSRPGVR